MTEAEQYALDWLRREVCSEVAFSKTLSPDFITAIGIGYEVKLVCRDYATPRIRTNSLQMLLLMRFAERVPCFFLVFDGGASPVLVSAIDPFNVERTKRDLRPYKFSGLDRDWEPKKMHPAEKTLDRFDRRFFPATTLVLNLPGVVPPREPSITYQA